MAPGRGEAAIELGRPRIAGHCNRAVSRDEYGRYAFVDSAGEDVNTGRFRLIHHSMRITAYRCPRNLRHHHRRARKRDQILAHGAGSAAYATSPEFLGDSDEKAFGPANIAEPIRLFVLHHVADQLRAKLAQSDERIVDVFHSEHHT